MSFVGLRLETYMKMTTHFCLIFAQSGYALLEVLIHFLNTDCGDIITERAVPDNKCRGFFNIRMPGFLQSAIRQVYCFCTQFFSGFSLFWIKRCDSTITEMTMSSWCNHRQVQVVINQCISNGFSVIIIDFRIIMKFNSQFNIIRQPWCDFISYKLNHFRGSETSTPFRSHITGDKTTFSRIECPSADTM